MGIGSVDMLASTLGHARLSTPEKDESALHSTAERAQQRSTSPHYARFLRPVLCIVVHNFIILFCV